MIWDVLFFAIGLGGISAIWFAAGYWFAKSRLPFPDPPKPGRLWVVGNRVPAKDLNKEIRDQLRRIA